MKLQFAALALSAAAALALVAGPAGAQGTFNPYGHRPPPPPSGFGPPPPGFGADETPGASGGHAHRRSMEVIEQPRPAKPYEPPKLGPSPYATPKPSPTGAKPCELSVYVNACDHHR